MSNSKYSCNYDLMEIERWPSPSFSIRRSWKKNVMPSCNAGAGKQTSQKVLETLTKYQLPRRQLTNFWSWAKRFPPKIFFHLCVCGVLFFTLISYKAHWLILYAHSNFKTREISYLGSITIWVGLHTDYAYIEIRSTLHKSSGIVL